MIAPRIRAAATMIGISPEEYAAHVASGEKWCSACQAWHPIAAFGLDKSTPSGTAHRCLRADAERKRARPREHREGKPRRPIATDHTAVLHEVYILAAARAPHAEIMDTIRAAVGRP